MRAKVREACWQLLAFPCVALHRDYGRWLAHGTPTRGSSLTGAARIRVESSCHPHGPVEGAAGRDRENLDLNHRFPAPNMLGGERTARERTFMSVHRGPTGIAPGRTPVAL